MSWFPSIKCNVILSIFMLQSSCSHLSLLPLSLLQELAHQLTLSSSRWLSCSNYVSENACSWEQLTGQTVKDFGHKEPLRGVISMQKGSDKKSKIRLVLPPLSLIEYELFQENHKVRKMICNRILNSKYKNMKSCKVNNLISNKRERGAVPE